MICASTIAGLTAHPASSARSRTRTAPLRTIDFDLGDGGAPAGKDGCPARPAAGDHVRAGAPPGPVGVVPSIGSDGRVEHPEPARIGDVAPPEFDRIHARLPRQRSSIACSGDEGPNERSSGERSRQRAGKARRAARDDEARVRDRTSAADHRIDAARRAHIGQVARACRARLIGRLDE